jgi:predicted lipoprotein with Yx(FWY)xxD motif
MLRAALLTPVLAAAVLAGCGGFQADDSATAAGARAVSAGQGSNPPSPTATAAASRKRAAARPSASRGRGRGRTVRVVRSQFGPILGDGKGQAVYVFDREKTSRSECYGACATAWPPVLTRARPRAGHGAAARLLGTTRRRDGKLQITYRGRPVYYYVGDAPGRVLCQGAVEFGGIWLVVRPDGEALR